MRFPALVLTCVFSLQNLRNIHVFQNVRNTVSDILVPPPPSPTRDLFLRSRLVRFLLAAGTTLESSTQVVLEVQSLYEVSKTT